MLKNKDGNIEGLLKEVLGSDRKLGLTENLQFATWMLMDVSDKWGDLTTEQYLLAKLRDRDYDPNVVGNIALRNALLEIRKGLEFLGNVSLNYAGMPLIVVGTHFYDHLVDGDMHGTVDTRSRRCKGVFSVIDIRGIPKLPPASFGYIITLSGVNYDDFQSPPGNRVNDRIYAPVGGDTQILDAEVAE